MRNSLERFIKDNRENFDTATPSSKVWDEIEKKTARSPAQNPLRFMKKKWWAIAASLALLIVAAAVYIVSQQPQTVKPIVSQQPQTVKPIVADNNKPITPKETLVDNDSDIEAIDPAYARQVAQFSDLIEEKQQELKAIRTDQPSLYEKFSDDIKRLDSTYHLLKHQLPVNPNKEELLQAMIYNLQLQIDLLNQQLNVIQKIKQSKSKTL